MTSGFGQFCPVALASEVLMQKWMPLIIRELNAGSSRFNDIRRGVPRISATLLKQRLDTLELAGIVQRRPLGNTAADEYILTEAGLELGPVLTAIGEWGQRWARDIEPDDLDPGWLVWNIRRRLNLALMPRGRTVIEIEFTDVPKHSRYFWLMHKNGNVDVCLKPPGFDVDLRLTTSVRTLAEIWRGIRPLRQEISNGNLGLTGTAEVRRAFPGWLLLSVFAPIKRQK